MTLNKPIKVVLINLLVLLAMVSVIEVSIYLVRIASGTPTTWGLFYYSWTDKYIEDHCKRVRTHPIYGWTHDHRDKCAIKGGKAVGPFVFYESAKDLGKNNILTLGGSTTDGYFNHINEGETWPYHLNKLCETEQSGCTVINGGVGGYGSTQELLKLVTDGSVLNKKISIVISLNGINDVPRYRKVTDLSTSLYPLYSAVQLQMFDRQQWVIQDRGYTIILPNIMSAIRAIRRKIKYGYFSGAPDEALVQTLSAKQALGDEPSRITNNIDKWLHNIKLMHHVSKSMGAEYFVFLQPTMGLKGVQSTAPNGTSDAEMLEGWLKTEHIKPLRETYELMKEHCLNVDFCFDISDKAPPAKNVYANPRHHNQFGNLIIAQEVLNILKNKSKYFQNIEPITEQMEIP